MNWPKAPSFVATLTGLMESLETGRLMESLESSIGNHQRYEQTDTHTEPFFDLMQHDVTKASSPNVNNMAKRMESADDDVLPSFDVLPVRCSSSAGGIEENSGGQNSLPTSYINVEQIVRRTSDLPASRSPKHEKESFDSAIATAFERTVKKYTESIMGVLEGIVSQLEKSSESIMNVVSKYHGETDAKLQSLERHISEVHRGIHVLSNRQETFETWSQLQLTSTIESMLQRSAVSPPAPISEPPVKLVSTSSNKSTPLQQVVHIPSASDNQRMPLITGPLNCLPSDLSSSSPISPQISPDSQQEQLHTVGTLDRTLDVSTIKNQSGQSSPLSPHLQGGHLSFGSGENGEFTQLQLAEVVPQALVAGGGSPGATLSGGPLLTSNGVGIDEVVDEVAVMGFPKDQVRAAVQHIIENNQAVDLVTVLHKLLNGKSAQRSSKGWLRR